MRGAWLASLALLATSPAQSAPGDDAAIRELEAAQEAAWNAHDAHAYAALFAPDAELVSSRGAVLHGSGEIERAIAQGFASVFASSRMRIADVSLRALGPDVMLARISWSIGGVRTPGAEERSDRQIVQTQVIARAGGGWRIAALQDTAVLGGGERVTAPDAGAAPPIAPPTPPAPRRRCIVGRSNGECLVYGKQR